MKKPTSALEYPVVLRKHLNFMTISVPDLNLTLVEELPRDQKLNKDYVTRIATKIAQAWVKTQQILHDKSQARSPLPDASDIRSSIKKKEKDLTPAQFGQLVGISKRTILRDCEKKLIQAKRTTGGHYKIPLSQLSLYQDYLKHHKKHAKDHWLRKAMEKLQKRQESTWKIADTNRPKPAFNNHSKPPQLYNRQLPSVSSSTQMG